MSGVAVWSSIPAIPVPVAVSVWAGGALALGLLLLGADDGAAQVMLAPVAAAPVVAGATPGESPSVRRTLPDGRDEAGSASRTGSHVRANLPWQNEASVYGWGSVRFDAEPVEDEIAVRTIVDAPTTTRRWAARCELRVQIDGDEVRVPAEHVGTRLKSGAFYDALRLELGIDTVRRMASAESVRGEICGDPFELPPVQRDTIRAFVEGFDDLALPVIAPRETERELCPVDPEEIVDDPDTYLEPA